MTFNKKLLAGLVSLAAASAANATVVVGGDNGFEFSVDGEINQFFVYTNNKAGVGSTKTSEVRDGLLPGFLGFNVKAPTTNGLDVAARVSISPSTNGTSRGTGSFEQREAFGTVSGSFGQILLGKALGLYGSHNILTDQTLYGVGWGTTGNGTTTLGRINMGYDYADWRSQIKWTSADMSGFKVALAVVDPAAAVSVINLPGAATSDTTVNRDPRYEADLSYASDFDGGNVMLWLSGMTQKNKGVVKNNKAWTAGGTMNFAGFELMAQYSNTTQGGASITGGALNTTANQPDVLASSALKAKYNQYIVQAGYNFGQGSKLVAGYANYNNKTKQANGAKVTNDKALDRDMWTVGIYHDVTANLKLVAEYSKLQSDNKNAAGAVDQSIFSVGGFVSW